MRGLATTPANSNPKRVWLRGPATEKVDQPTGWWRAEMSEMVGSKPISNTEDVIDSRDIIARIEYLEGQRIDLAPDEISDDEDQELADLHALAEDAKASPDWTYGEALIRDSYFTEYAQELADDIGAIDRNASWPLNYIDWEAAAEALQADYFEVDFDGVTYWIRA